MKQQPSGQTLLESLLAIAIILIGILSLLGLLITLRRTSESTLDQALAMQLTQESVEAVRSIRDSNWLEQESGLSVTYNEGLRSGTDYNGVYVWDPTEVDPADAMTIEFFSGGSITSSVAIVYQDSNGYYRQTSTTVPSDWTNTKFRRWLTLYPICYDSSSATQVIVSSDGTDCSTVSSGGSFSSGSGGSFSVPTSYEEIGIQVVSTVQWTERGNTKNLTYEERLYNWKYAS